MPDALAGLRVLDISNTSTGAQTSQFLCDYGAEVVHVEPPGGSPLRAIPGCPLWGRGKKSIELDLKSPDDLAVARGLAATCDVFIETFRPGVAERLGLGYEALRADSPRLVYTSITGFGRQGPYANVKGYEGLVLASLGGFYTFGMLTEREGPAFVSTPFGSYSAAQTALQGTLAALVEREHSGAGQRVEANLVQGISSQSTYGWYMHLIASRYPEAFQATGVFDADGVPNASLYFRLVVALTADGQWLQFSQTQPRLFKAFIDSLGLAWMREDPKWKTLPDFDDPATRREFWERLLTAVRAKSFSEWQQIFADEPDVWAEVFRSGHELLDHPQLVHDGQIVEIIDPERGAVRQPAALVRMTATPARLDRPAPRRDEHAAELRARAAESVTAGSGAGGAASSATSESGRSASGRLPSEPPLAGVAVLELGTFFAAPYGATILTDLGARVIKIEQLDGEPMRNLVAFPEAGGAKVLQGKESVAIDIRTDEGRELVYEITRRCDLVLQTFRAGVADRLGYGPEQLRAINPNLVYLTAPGYGVDGPCGHKPAFAPTIGAGSGMAQRNTGGNVPANADLTLDEVKRYSRRLQTSVSTEFVQADGVAALGVGSALVLGLLARERGAGGQAMLTSMLSTAAHALSDDMVDYPNRPPLPAPDPDLYGLNALYRLYHAADGWVFLAAPADAEWQPLIEALTVSAPGNGLDADPRFADAAGRREHDGELSDAIGAILSTRPAEDWERDLLAADVGCVVAREMSVEERLMSDDFGRASGYLADIDHPTFGEHPRLAPFNRFSRSATVALPGQLLGDSTDAVLSEIGVGADRIADLRARGIII